MALTDPETCSWCTEEVEDSSLRTTNDGARICRSCVTELSLKNEISKFFTPECRTKIPERHFAGEFPMTCYDCHMVADS